MMSARDVLVEVGAVAIVVASATLLPDRWIDYGMLTGIVAAFSYPVVTHWHLERFRPVNIAVAAGVIVWLAYSLWPLNRPFW